MKEQIIFLKLCIKRLMLMMTVYTIFRLLFFLFNFQTFSAFAWSEIFLCFLLGLRFDLSAIIYVNSIFMLLHFIPLKVRYKKNYQSFLKWIFFVSNFTILISGLIDIKWFGFVEKRMTFQIFSTLHDANNQLPSYLLEYWYLIPIYVTVIWLTLIFYNRISNFSTGEFYSKANYKIQLMIMIALAGLAVVGARGGLQARPIVPIVAAHYVNPSLIPLVTNTPFSLLLSVQSPSLKELKYFDEAELNQRFCIQCKNYKQDQSVKRRNVVIIIWESLSRYFVGSLNNRKGYTPFLDSLIAKSLVCTNASANAHRSVEGIPAVVASIPNLMEESINISAYQQDKIFGLGSVLKIFGYSSAFFHGGVNGTMSFDNFMNAAGFENYYGMNEYPDKSDYDGAWGIYDEPFLQFTLGKINLMKPPFLATIFTVTSHPPFAVPEKFKSVFKKDEVSDYSQVMQYTDYSLRKFFESASSQSWYDSTLFVIVADHGVWYNDETAWTPKGRTSIPILFFSPSENLSGINSSPVQQVDIVPSIIDYLNLNCHFVSFGKSVFSSDSTRFTFDYLNGIYHIEDNEYHLEFDGTKSISLFDYKRDALFRNNLIDLLPEKKTVLENQIKAVIQVYNHALINNKLLPE